MLISKVNLMKLLPVCFLLSFYSCASLRTQQTQIPVFKDDKVCSPKAMEYLKDQKKPHNYTKEELHSYMLKLEPLIRTCYQNEMERTGVQNSFNLCLVVGLDNNGNQDFFEFSTSEVSLSDTMRSCLREIEPKADFGRLKDISLIQPYRLYPKK